MIIDELWPDGPRFIRDGEAFRLGTDSVLLADFASKGRVARVCDLGCGIGVLSILSAWDRPSVTVDGVELQEDWANIARENTQLCRLESRIRILNGDLRRHRIFLEAGVYDLVVSNPPYYSAGSGKSSDNDQTATARQEHACTLDDVCAAASYLTRWGGRFALVHKPERLADIIRTLSNYALEPKRLRFVQNKADAVPSLVLIESRRGGKASLTVEAPLILTNESGGDSDEIIRIYHRT